MRCAVAPACSTGAGELAVSSRRSTEKREAVFNTKLAGLAATHRSLAAAAAVLQRCILLTDGTTQFRAVWSMLWPGAKLVPSWCQGLD